MSTSNNVSNCCGAAVNKVEQNNIGYWQCGLCRQSCTPICQNDECDGPNIEKVQGGHIHAPRPTEGWEERFDKKFEDVIVSTSRNDPDVYMDEWKEVGNIKSFIAAELAKAREEGYDKGADEWAENLKIAVEKEKKIALASYRAELENLWTIVRPFVVGYAAEHNVGNNRKMAIEAEEIVSRLLAEHHQEEK